MDITYMFNRELLKINNWLFIYGEFNKNRKRKNSVKREKLVQYKLVKSQSPEQEEW